MIYGVKLERRFLKSSADRDLIDQGILAHNVRAQVTSIHDLFLKKMHCIDISGCDLLILRVFAPAG